MKQIINRLLDPFNVALHGKGYLQSLAKGEFKKDAFEIQKQLLQNQKIETIFDIGANRGEVIHKYLELFPNAIIHAFEPFPASFKQLSDKFANNKRVILNQLAVSNKATKMKMFVNYNVDTNSLLESNESGLSSDKQVKTLSEVEVDCTTIDNYCSKKKINIIDILKMDIQGGEYDALLGAIELLSNKNIYLIYTEAYFVKQYKNQPLIFDIANVLLKNGYKMQDIYNPIYGNGNIAWCDTIFVR